MNRWMLALLCSLTVTLCYAESVVNVYLWGGEIPQAIIREFTEKTGIKVNLSTYDNNETMFAKLSANTAIYDVILPSAYFVERMQRHGLLEPLNATQLPNRVNLAAAFSNNDYDPDNRYSIPFIWGVTGIAYNSKYITTPPKAWRDLWSARFKHQLMLLDDARDVFALALFSLGYSLHDHNRQHIQQAFQYLLQLKDNIKLFASEGIQALLIDEDVHIATAWNGDAFKAHSENPAIQFVYPEEGFVIWVDCLAIPKHPPHPQQAHAFINFMLEAQTGVQIATLTGHAITNQSALTLLPQSIRHNHMVYPDATTLQRGVMQRDVNDSVLRLYNQYWQALKLAF